MLQPNDFKPDQGFWKIAPGRGAKYWGDCLAGNYMCVGWDAMGDLSQYSDRDEFNEAWAKQYPDTKKEKSEELFDFFHVKAGDIVVANRGITSIVGIGTATGNYWFDEKRGDYQHCIGVNWEKKTEAPFQANAKSVVKDWGFKTVKPLSREEYQILTATDNSVGHPANLDVQGLVF